MKPHFRDLTPEQQATYGNGCGLQARLLRVPDFIFKASCAQHDFNYERGGGLYYKFKADVDFWAAMIADAEHTKWPLGWALVSTVYFIGVTVLPFSYFVFTYGRWRSKEEILERDRRAKL